MASHETKDDELIRTALRIAQRTWSKLEADSPNMTETEVMKEYIRLCPYVPSDSPVVLAALQGIDSNASTTAATATARAVPPTRAPRASDVGIETRTPPTRTLVPETIATRPPSPLPPPPSQLWRVARVLCLDIPLILLVFTMAAAQWLHHVHDHYLYPQYLDAMWTGERSEQEITYYVRHCTAEDMTTKNGSDLFLPDGATTEEAYQHQLQHGFSVFRDVLSSETAENLRNHVISKNHNLTDEESIFVIENTNRYSFGLGTEEPAVAQAMKELATNERLKPALEKVLGPNPSLIEMTAITSSYGAVAQYWHDDVIPTASAVNFARTFGPSYSVFVQLQNTTKEMGATSACPGTHYCSDGNMYDFCEEEGFQLVNEDGHWKQGDALLMNMNSYHRGAAHTDPDGLDRVMLILTFAPRPMERAESRQMSQGITFSLRWDMWGHTLYDLENADTVMTQPWATLRSLGLYKPKGASWGIDYISGSIMRMASADNGFRRDQLEDFLQAGGIRFLPRFLHGKIADTDNWYEFLIGTFLLCKAFLQKIVIVVLVAYILAHLFALFYPGHKSRLALIRGTSFRLVGIIGCAAIAYYAAKIKVDRTGWASDIKAHRRYASTVQSEITFAESSDHWPTTFPTNADVLFETRYGSRQLAMYNDFIDGHPANRFYNDLVAALAPTYVDYPFEFQEASAAYVLGAVGAQQGRFLYQAPDGAWYFMDPASVIARTKRDLLLASNPILSTLAQEIRFLVSDLKYGTLRETAMSAYHTALFLKMMDEKILTGSKQGPTSSQRLVSSAGTVMSGQSVWFRRLFRLPKCSIGQDFPPRRASSLPPASTYDEPFHGSWISEGDTVEGVSEDHWYKGNVTFVSAKGTYSISYPDGDANVVDAYHIRRFQPYTKGEELEVYFQDEYVECEVVRWTDRNKFTVLVRDTGAFESGFVDEDFRRLKGELPERYEYKAAY